METARALDNVDEIAKAEEVRASEPPRRVHQHVDSLDNAVDSLTLEIGRLFEELQPVLSTTTEDSPSGMVLPDGLSPLAERIAQLEDRIQHVRNVVAEARHRLEV